ncbi:jg793 [Pararge aegeria aegeria]|uniref:Jg793 protein n=1 Tax=Pararge aegeria aegeria TaxID=348720 RepID=A0A8S4QJ29_9NEOP|nr:jg793 [Pararge aegeria aegeria]
MSIRNTAVSNLDPPPDTSNGNNYMSGEPRRKREPPARPNHILLYTIINPAYPITVPLILVPSFAAHSIGYKMKSLEKRADFFSLSLSLSLYVVFLIAEGRDPFHLQPSGRFCAI